MEQQINNSDSQERRENTEKKDVLSKTSKKVKQRFSDNDNNDSVSNYTIISGVLTQVPEEEGLEEAKSNKICRTYAVYPKNTKKRNREDDSTTNSVVEEEYNLEHVGNKKKREDVTTPDVSGVEGFWLSIEFCQEKDFSYFLSLSSIFHIKEMFTYLLKILDRKIPFVICSSGWGRAKNLAFISTNLEAIRSNGGLAEICIHASMPLQSRLITISLPMCSVIIKDYILTPVGRRTTKPTLEDLKYAEAKMRESPY